MFGRKRFGRHLAVIAVFTIPAVVLWWNAWSKGASSYVRCSCLDPGQQVWFVAWPAYAIAHGMNPFFTTWLWPPHGANLLNNASAPLAGIVLSPITWLFGPLVATTLALTLAPALSAWGAWLASGRFVTWMPARWVAGFLFGYSPFVVQSIAGGHLSTGLLVFLPLMVLVLHEIMIRQQRSTLWCGGALGVLILAQFLISAEMLTIMLGVGAVGVALAALMAPRAVAAQFPYAIRSFGYGALVTAVLMALPVWFMMRGPQHISGSLWGGLRYFFTAAAFQLWTAGPDRALLWPGGFLGPPMAFLGFGLLAILTLSLAAARRQRTAWFMAVMLVIGTLLSWGGFIVLREGFVAYSHWLPWTWVYNLPVFMNVNASHFAGVGDLAAALLVAVGLNAFRTSRLWNRLPIAAWIAVGCGVAVAVVVPVWSTFGVPFAVQPPGLPRWYTTAALSVPAGAVVLSYPFPASASVTAEPMVWQSVDGMRFKLAGGYIKVPGPKTGVIGQGAPGSATQTLDQLTLSSDGATGLTLSAFQLTNLRAAISKWGTSYIVVSNTGRRPTQTAAIFTAATGVLPRIQHRAWVWDLRSQPLLNDYDATAAAHALVACQKPTPPNGSIPPTKPLPQSFNACVYGAAHS
jgi:hypothetical protein